MKKNATSRHDSIFEALNRAIDEIESGVNPLDCLDSLREMRQELDKDKLEAQRLCQTCGSSQKEHLPAGPNARQIRLCPDSFHAPLTAGECEDCEHPRDFHNAAGCGIDQCGCLRYAPAVETREALAQRLMAVGEKLHDRERDAERDEIGAIADALMSPARTVGTPPQPISLGVCQRHAYSFHEYETSCPYCIAEVAAAPLTDAGTPTEDLAYINPAILNWALAQSPLSLMTISDRIRWPVEDIGKWRNGQPVPWAAMRKLAGVLEQPFGLFWLSEPPSPTPAREALRLGDFSVDRLMQDIDDALAKLWNAEDDKERRHYPNTRIVIGYGQVLLLLRSLITAALDAEKVRP